MEDEYLFYVTDKHKHFLYWFNQKALKLTEQGKPVNRNHYRMINPERFETYAGLQFREHQLEYDPLTVLSAEFRARIKSVLTR